MALTDMVPTACGEPCNGVVLMFTYAEGARFGSPRRVEMRGRRSDSKLGALFPLFLQLTTQQSHPYGTTN
jgi:hypothetical protein